MVKVLFVCMGNICRSPTAEGVFVHMVGEHSLQEQIEVDSAGTHAYHVGHEPDRRAQQTAAKRGIDISKLRARRVKERDFEQYDYVIAMDEDNMRCLEEVCPPGYEQKLGLFLKYAPNVPETEVPDPYYGGPTGFERVMDMVEQAAGGLLEEIRRSRL